MSIVRLERVYASTLSRPTISAVDTRIFQFRYFRQCLHCSFCKDQCCAHGVDIDLRNARALELLGTEFEQFVGCPKESWFTEGVIEDAEFPSGYQLRTRVRDGYCVFHDRTGRGCAIHSWCTAMGLDYRAFKPMVSVLFPVTFHEQVLLPATEVLDGTLVCTGVGDTLYCGAREELRFYFGQTFVDELDSIARGCNEHDQREASGSERLGSHAVQSALAPDDEET